MRIQYFALALLSLFLCACTGVPKNVTPVSGFKTEPYLGRWYEIARLDHSFERGMSRVTAEYSMRSDGGLRVLNRGYLDAEQKWKEAEGRAYFVGASDQGHLKVSFFGPFYGSYVVFDLDQTNYQYSLVSGPDTSYLWILARTPQISDALKQQLVAKAAAAGFAVDKLIWVQQDAASPSPIK